MGHHRSLAACRLRGHIEGSRAPWNLVDGLRDECLNEHRFTSLAHARAAAQQPGL